MRWSWARAKRQFDAFCADPVNAELLDAAAKNVARCAALSEAERQAEFDASLPALMDWVMYG